ncbi:MAG: transcription elongation factor GreA [Patescibacteria group bacterium]
MDQDNNKPYYVSEAGLAKLKQKLELLKTAERQRLIERLKDAVDQGDLSENSEYQAVREAQTLNETKILELENLIKRAEVIKKKNQTQTVMIGSTVRLNQGEKKLEFTIVGSEETDPAQGFISNESPLGQALLGKKAGDEVAMTNMVGKEIKYKIIKIL